MKRTSIWNLPKGSGNFLDGILPVGRFKYGGLHIYEPDEVSHADEERHTHTGHYEVFVCLQGGGVVEVEGVDHSFELGDVILIEPGESHHVRANPLDPVANLYIGTEIRGE